MSEFRDSAPSAPAVFYRSYSRRKPDGTRESYPEAITRTVNDLADIGGLTKEQRALCLEMGLKQHAFPSGRALWVAGTEWAKKPENFPGYYNCQSGFVDDVNMFGLLMELAMCGTGTGAVLEQEVVDRLPKVVNGLLVIERIENEDKGGGREDTFIEFDQDSQKVVVTVGDSRRGWVDAYQGLIELAMGLRCEDHFQGAEIPVVIDLSQVRQAGEPLKGFGGVANPIRLGTTLERVAALLNKAKGRKLTPIECCLLVDEAASAVVAGNIRRSAGMRQFSSSDSEAACAKDNLYTQDEEGNWKVDPQKEALRMANHTRCFHHKPTIEEVKASVIKQFWSGEGAIQYVPEMVARSNADLLNTSALKEKFLKTYETKGKEGAKLFLKEIGRAHV
jgi:ribonucleotide reductase class II